MAAAEYYSGACMDMVPAHLLAPHMLQRAQSEQVGMRKGGDGIAQGRIMWLPAMEDLPERAVRRAHGKGAVEEGIYNHPVVVVSRPLDDERCVPGTCPSRPAPTIQTQIRRRRRSASRPSHWRMVLPCDGNHMSTFDMSTRPTGLISNLTRIWTPQTSHLSNLIENPSQG